MVRVKKGSMCIDPGPVDAQAVVFLTIRKAKRCGVLTWTKPLLGNDG